MTETEWVSRWNAEVANVIHICEEIMLAVEAPDLMRIVLDSGATSTVVGRNWMQAYYQDKAKPMIGKSSKSFRFGDSSRHGSMGVVRLEFEIDALSACKKPTGLLCCVEADIVNYNVPLLISRTALTRVSGILNFSDNSLLAKGKYLIRLQ